MSTFMKLFSED